MQVLTIKNIKRIPTKDRYDITIPKTNNFFANNILIHNTSARYYNTLTTRQLPWYEKLAKWFGVKVVEEEYNYVSASRRCIKSLNFKTLDGKGHYYDGDVWTRAGEQHFKDRLNKGEAVYAEIIGKDQYGKEIQSGYSYGFGVPKVYIYRISNISPQGIEIDLHYLQMKERAAQLGVETCPELFYGTLKQFIDFYSIGLPQYDQRDVGNRLEEIFYNHLLEKPSILDSSCIEEGFCVRSEGYPRPTILKIKSKAFLLGESKNLDKDIVDIEEQS